MNERVCPRCGAAVSGNAFCAQCGLNLSMQHDLPEQGHEEAYRADSGGDHAPGDPRGRRRSLGTRAKGAIAAGAAVGVAAIAAIVLLATGVIGGSNGQSGGSQAESGVPAQEEGGQSDASYDEEIGYEEGGEYPEEVRFLYVDVCEEVLGHSASTCQAALRSTESSFTLNEVEGLIYEVAENALEDGRFPYTEEGELEAIMYGLIPVVEAAVLSGEGSASVASLRSTFRHMLLSSTLEKETSHILFSPTFKKEARQAARSHTG